MPVYLTQLILCPKLCHISKRYTSIIKLKGFHFQSCGVLHTRMDLSDLYTQNLLISPGLKMHIMSPILCMCVCTYICIHVCVCDMYVQKCVHTINYINWVVFAAGGGGCWDSRAINWPGSCEAAGSAKQPPRTAPKDCTAAQLGAGIYTYL